MHVCRNVYLRGDRYYVYVYRLGTRHFIGSFDGIDEAKVERNKFEAKHPPLKPHGQRTGPRKTSADRYRDARAKGLCVACGDCAVPGKSRCMDCTHIHKLKRAGVA